MKTFVIGDIHGAYKALLQCLERSGFDYQNHRLIVLGDVCDGYPEVDLCFDELLKLKNRSYILGNHDKWAYDFYKGKIDKRDQDVWLSQGGSATYDAYAKVGGMPTVHLEMLRNASLFLEECHSGVKRLFVHGGFDPNRKLQVQDPEICLWDRKLLIGAKARHGQEESFKFGGYDEIYIGHTTTQTIANSTLPVHFCNVWALDTGAGWSGKLTVMDIETKQYWQSDLVTELYKGVQGRTKWF